MSVIEIILGVVSTVLLSIVAYFIADFHNQYKEHVKEATVSQIEFVKLSADMEGLKEKYEDLCERLDGMEKKIDDLPEEISKVIVRGQNG